MKSKRAKACDIPSRVKRNVWERDGFKCILCGNRNAMPNAHYRSRAKGGLGIEKNIVTLCMSCHHNYDQTTMREAIKVQIQNYLMKKYNDWKEEDVCYKKGESYGEK